MACSFMGEKKLYSTDSTTGASLYSTTFTSGKGLHILSSDPSSDILIIAVGNTNQQLAACADRVILQFSFSRFSLLFLL